MRVASMSMLHCGHLVVIVVVGLWPPRHCRHLSVAIASELPPPPRHCLAVALAMQVTSSLLCHDHCVVIGSQPPQRRLSVAVVSGLPHCHHCHCLTVALAMRVMSMLGCGHLLVVIVTSRVIIGSQPPQCCCHLSVALPMQVSCVVMVLESTLLLLLSPLPHHGICYGHGVLIVFIVLASLSSPLLCMHRSMWHCHHCAGTGAGAGAGGVVAIVVPASSWSWPCHGCGCMVATVAMSSRQSWWWLHH